MCSASVLPMVDFRAIVNEVADEFEREYRFQVHSKARGLLIKRADPYTSHVQEELVNERITIDFLADSLTTVLIHARVRAMAQKRNMIDEQTILESMKEECPYLFWC